MAISNYAKQPHFPIQQKLAFNSSNFDCTNFLCKSLLVLAILIFLTFPFSQGSDFFNHITLTKNWDLIHSLFVSIVVSCFFITRKSVQNGVETRPHFNYSTSYVSGFFNFGSGIEYGMENSCGSSEKNNVRVCSVSKFRSGLGEKRANQALIFQCFDNGSRVVTCDASYVVNEKPLGLPIRNLKSPVDYLSWSGLDSKSLSKIHDKLEKGIFGDLRPVNLEKLFDECVDEYKSTRNWNLRSSTVNLSWSGSDSKILSKNHEKLENGIIFGDLRPVNLEKLFDECVDEAQSARMMNNDTSNAENSMVNQKFCVREKIEKHEDDVGLEIYEVDRKAEEFIARFKYQIRLQKV